MSFSDAELITLMDAYSDAHPNAEPVDNFAELFSRDDLVRMLTQAQGRAIAVEVTYGGPAVDFRPVATSYRYV